MTIDNGADYAAQVEKVDKTAKTSGNDNAGAAAAAKTLYDQYNKEVTKFGQPTANQWLADATRQLQKDGYLPDITIGVLNNDFGSFSGSSDTINRRALQYDNTHPGSGAAGLFDQQFVGLLNNANGGSPDLLNQVNKTLGTKDGLQEKNLTDYLNKQDTENHKAADQSNVRNSSDYQALFANNGQLLKSLDIANADNANPDGKINNDDLKAWLKQYDKIAATSGAGTGVYTEDNRKVVQRILDGKDKDNGLSADGFTYQSLASKGGFGSVKDGDIAGLAANYQKAIASDRALACKVAAL